MARISDKAAEPQSNAFTVDVVLRCIDAREFRRSDGNVFWLPGSLEPRMCRFQVTGIMRGSNKKPGFDVHCVYPLDQVPGGMGYRSLVSLRRALIAALEQRLPGVKIYALELDRIDIKEVALLGRDVDRRSEAAQKRAERNRKILRMAERMSPGGAISDEQASRIGAEFSVPPQEARRVIGVMRGAWTGEEDFEEKPAA